MDSPFLKAQHYLDQAEKMRNLAMAEEDLAKRNALLEIAKGYERLAQKFLAEGQEKLDRKG